MKVARFKADRKDGLREAYIFVDNVFLPFVNDEAAEYFDDNDTGFNLLWRIDGPTGSSLEVTMAVEGSPAQTIVRSKIRASDHERRSDSNTISLG